MSSVLCFLRDNISEGVFGVLVTYGYLLNSGVFYGQQVELSGEIPLESQTD